MAIDGSDVQAGGRRRSGPLQGVLAIGVVLLLKVARPIAADCHWPLCRPRVCAGGTRAASQRRGRSRSAQDRQGYTVLAVTLRRPAR
jgi:hypothetical protein